MSVNKRKMLSQKKINEEISSLKYPVYNKFNDDVYCPVCGVEYPEGLKEKMEYVGECHGRPMYEAYIICPHCDERILIK